MPENFLEIHRLWRGKQLTLTQAARACGLPKGTFYAKARKLEEEETP